MYKKGKSPTKGLILKSALELFSRHGFKGATIRMIASDVGIRESSVYSFFKSKEEILKAIVKDYQKRKINAKVISEEILDYIGKPLKFMKKYCEKMITYWDSPLERAVLRLYLIEQFTGHNDLEISLEAFLKEQQEVWSFVFDKMIEYRLIKKTDARLLAEEFTSYLYFLRIKYLTGEKGENVKEALKLAYKHCEFFWEAIKP
jgi:AcrR family transcriptional regulator